MSITHGIENPFRKYNIVICIWHQKPICVQDVLYLCWAVPVYENAITIPVTVTHTLLKRKENCYIPCKKYHNYSSIYVENSKFGFHFL